MDVRHAVPSQILLIIHAFTIRKEKKRKKNLLPFPPLLLSGLNKKRESLSWDNYFLIKEHYTSVISLFDAPYPLTLFFLVHFNVFVFYCQIPNLLLYFHLYYHPLILNPGQCFTDFKWCNSGTQK